MDHPFGDFEILHYTGQAHSRECGNGGGGRPGGVSPFQRDEKHMRCYAERADVGAVVHAHPPTATGYAVANKPLDAYSMIETVIAIGSIPVTPYGTPSTYEVPTPLRPTCRNTMCCCCRTTAR